MTSAGEPPALRVGDRERERAADELRVHHLDGRLDDGELEERLERTYAARTIADLGAVLVDLPERGRRGIVPAAPAPAPPAKPGGFGLLPFTFVHDLPASPEEAYAAALDAIGTAMVAFGYAVVERREGEVIVFAQQERPGWVPVVCVAAFPVGLLALTVKRTTHVRLEVLPRPGGGSRLRVSGEARRAVRKAFSTLTA